MSDFQKLAHSIWQCKYHVVWCPKYRFRVLTGDIGRRTDELIRQLCAWRKVGVLEANVQADPVHLVLSIPPKYAISDVVGFVKGKSAIKLFAQYTGLKRRYWGRHFWAKGYCVSTVGLDEEQVRQYVRWQLKQDQTADQLSLWNK